MAQCVIADPTTGALSVSSADPCTSLVVLTPAEYAVFSTNPLTLSAEDGATLSAAIATVWVVAWGIRAIYRAVGSDGLPADE